MSNFEENFLWQFRCCVQFNAELDYFMQRATTEADPTFALRWISAVLLPPNVQCKTRKYDSNHMFGLWRNVSEPKCAPRRHRVGGEILSTLSEIQSKLISFSSFFRGGLIRLIEKWGRMSAAVSRGLSREAACWSLQFFSFLSLAVDAAAPAPVCTRQHGASREAQLSKKPVRDCFIVPTVQFSEGQIWYSPPRSGVFPFQAPTFFSSPFFFPFLPRDKSKRQSSAAAGRIQRRDLKPISPFE